MIRFILLLAVLSAFPPLSTDMYLPAIPFLQTLWNQPLSVINLTLVLFFAVYCACLLVYGPLSDRFGRKPPLVTGIAIYIGGSFLCAFATGIEMLIAARIVQAAGAASASSISMAIVKDRLEAREREAVMGYVSVIMALAPMVAPMIGSLIITRFTWPWIFATQGAMGLAMALHVFPGPWALAVPMGGVSFFLGISRPPANNLALEQVRRDAGAASSLLVFIYFILGAAAMAVASLDWENKVLFLGILGVVAGGTASLLWLFVKTRIRLPETARQAPVNTPVQVPDQRESA